MMMTSFCPMYVCVENVWQTKNQGPKSKKWADEEEVYLIEQTSRNHETLFGKMSGTGAEKIKTLRKNAWTAIADGLNA